MKIEILFEDNDIIVLYKPSGMPSQSGQAGSADVVSEVKNYLASAKKDTKEPYVGLVHRLDQPVEGILVVGKNERAASGLSRQIAANSVKKIYYAAVFGKTAMQEGVLVDFLLKNGKTNTSGVVDRNIKDAKRAELQFKVLECRDANEISILEIKLKTGRHHQIRVQLANAGLPVLGDFKYGTEKSRQISKKAGVDNIALCAVRLDFIHPVNKKELSFRIKPRGKIFVPDIGRE